MGQGISRSSFSETEHAEFRSRLRCETAVLKRWFEERAFLHCERPTTGLELEAWLIDQDGLPAPHNAEFIAAVADPRVVPELSKFNFELNAEPQPLVPDFLERTQCSLEELWRSCAAVARARQLDIVAIGILPTVRDEMLQPDWMSDGERYRALNREIFRLRGAAPLHIDIAGADRLEYHCNHVMLEAACTSLQGHLRVRQDQALRFYNASIIAAAPLVAASANSPFLYGKSLWAETRVPAFEQATAHHSFVDPEGRQVRRVTLGTGYVRHSLLELFLENLGYPALLPMLADGEAKLGHLRLHNGTIWRWVRPIIGFEPDGTPHMRLELRVMPAGPTIADSIANLALCYGLVFALGQESTPPEQEISFEDARENFYACARDGLAARVHWRGKLVGMQALLLEQLLPAAKSALARDGVDSQALEYYFDGLLRPRLISGLTGERWQRSFIEIKGADFQGLLQRYAELQWAGAPVHTWHV